MTSLHYTLIALGVGLVVAMFLYNLFQERRSRKQAELIFGLHPGDQPEGQSVAEMPSAELPAPDAVAFGSTSMPEHSAGGRIEPRIDLSDDYIPDDDRDQPSRFESHGDEDGHRVAMEVPPPQRLDPVHEAAPAAVEQPRHIAEPVVRELEPESSLDGAIEYIARFRYSHPTALVFATLQENLRRISKPIRLLGRREDGAWEPVLAHASRTYDTVELSLLLADRAGPVSDVQLDSFCRRLYEFATQHGGAVSCQDKPAALERAKTLDAFCAEVDMLIGLNVISSSGLDFSSQAINELAGRSGLTPSADGSYGLRDGEGRLLFTLATHNELLDPSESASQGTQSLSLLFDVPRVAHGLAAFDRMANLGFELAQRLGGQLVDDGGRPVSRESLTKDRKHLEMLYARMEQNGIPAGGERALRLFA
jgi:hypothetical protein